MIFGPTMIPKVLDGSKTVTRRLVKYEEASDMAGRATLIKLPCRYRLDHEYSVQPGRARPGVGRIKIVDVGECQLRGVISGVGEAAREGFANGREFLDYWEALHGPAGDLSAPVWRIEFRLVVDNWTPAKTTGGGERFG